jgi:DNA-binding MarR family transcriptional regulator
MPRPVLVRPDIQAFAEIAAIDQMVTRAMERRLPRELGRAQFNILSRLDAEGDQSPGELASHLVLTKGAVTHLLGRLESQGLVAVRPVPGDSRRKRIRLTETGARVLSEATLGLRELALTLRAALPAEGFEQTLPLLAALRAHLIDVR